MIVVITIIVTFEVVSYFSWLCMYLMSYCLIFSFFLRVVRRTGDSIGGVVEVVARNVPAGLGSPVFDKLEAELAKAVMSLPASKGFEVCAISICSGLIYMRCLH